MSEDRIKYANTKDGAYALFQIPSELKRKFKATCAMNKISMRNALISLMDIYIKKSGNN